MVVLMMFVHICQVHLCEAVRVAEFLGEDFLESGAGSLLVALKTLRNDATQQARSVLQPSHQSNLFILIYFC